LDFEQQREQARERIADLENQLQSQSLLAVYLSEQLASLKLDHKRTVHLLEAKVFELEQSLENVRK
jgi:hypothetical protein